MVDIPPQIAAFIICIFMAAAGAVVVSSGSTLPMLINAGWIFLVGGIIGAGLSGYSMAR